MLELRPTSISGCYELGLPRFEDDRGVFTKTFQHSAFSEAGLSTDFVEQFHTSSRRGVVRGLHLQAPPAAHDKLVACIAGSAWDVIVDLRLESPTYGEHAVVVLSGDDGVGVYVPEGCAHGFLSLADDTVLAYWVTTEHAPDYDIGVRWDSMDISWPLDGVEPLVSARDQALPAFDAFVSPFSYQR